MDASNLDLEAASAAMVEGWNKCGIPYEQNRPKCDCDHGAIDGCRERRAAIARAIAAAWHRGWEAAHVAEN